MGIVEEASKIIKLNKNRHIYKGICPIHKENTPSFVVNQKTQKFKCFGCGVNGDVDSFIYMASKLKDAV